MALNHSRQLLSTDLKDKIDAIVGLVQGFDTDQIGIDYNKTLLQVYVDAIHCLLRENKLLDFLALTRMKCSEQNAFPS
jgi:hypothetical protein